MNGFSDDQILRSWRIGCTRIYGVYVDTWSDQPYLPIPAVKLVDRLVTQSQSLRLWNIANGMNCRFTSAQALPLTYTSPTLTLTAHIVLSYPFTTHPFNPSIQQTWGTEIITESDHLHLKRRRPQNGPQHGPATGAQRRFFFFCW